MIPQIGDRMRFQPDCFPCPKEGSELPVVLDGTIVYVNTEHRYYIVAAKLNGYEIRESFKF